MVIGHGIFMKEVTGKCKRFDRFCISFFLSFFLWVMMLVAGHVSNMKELREAGGGV